MTAVSHYMDENKKNIFDDIQELVAHQSPSTDKLAVDKCGAFLEQLFTERLGTKAQRFPRQEVGDNRLFTIGSGSRKVLLIAHFDTVWDIGRLGTYIEDDKFYGPGGYDMKAGLVQGLWAVKALLDLDLLGDRKILFLCTTDEETGSHHSRPLIEETAQGCECALVLEPAVEGSDDLKVGRKGSANYFLTLRGKSSHAGNNPLGGISAAEEMAHQILRINALQDMSRGTSVNVGVAQSGTRTNVIPDTAHIAVDVRITTREEAQRIEQAIYNLQPVLDGARIEVEGQLNRPPMEFGEGTRKLFKLAQSCALELGFELEGSEVGGGSDGNFTAAMGIPTLDGLGALGGGAHAEYEHIRIKTIPQRAALVAELIAAL
ncbi:M20 family metallopeptidase [Carnimonas nigrificans]|uniref:M20 family metallopeptidase n=1 Tax=Carnimonas nigrificans TaxID=64323 RepID=UPI00046F6B3D|nr:M20 family metallopeptidase [Carnimonas nigrificans]